MPHVSMQHVGWQRCNLSTELNAGFALTCALN